MKKYRFTAKVESAVPAGTYVIFPYDVEKEFGTRGRVPVKATFNGVPYSGSLAKYREAQHMLGLLKEIREKIGARPGDSIQVEVWRDDQPREVEVPAEFKAAMKKGGVLPFFESLSYTHRKEYCRWITEAKREATRLNRSEKAIEMLEKKVKTPG